MKSEGAIKYKLSFEKAGLVDRELIVELNAWRNIMYQLKLVGQDNDRYEGYCFGNMSRRLQDVEQFVITASQTGYFAELDSSHYTIVTAFDTSCNQIFAKGKMEPSSEALSHAAVYQVLPDVHFVYHAHSPAIWRKAKKLHIPTTSPEAPYGTVELAAEISYLCREEKTRQCRIVSMGGHEDGIIVFGKTAAEAGTALVSYLAAADATD